EAGLVRPQDPADEHGGEGVEGHECAVDGPFFLHYTGVENHEARNRLEGHEGGGGELPCIVTCAMFSVMIRSALGADGAGSGGRKASQNGAFEVYVNLLPFFRLAYFTPEQTSS